MKLEQKKQTVQRFLELLPPEEHQEIRVRNYYLKVLDWIVGLHKANQPSAAHPPVIPSVIPLIIGVNGPQGSGKSTLTAALVQVLADLGLRAVTLSIDDFYLTRPDQLALAAAHSSNPLLQQRGYPGTHDTQLGLQKLRELRGVASTGFVRIPLYDKSKHQGQGDRFPESDWAEIRGPLDVVLFEGWMLGFKPASDTALVEATEIKGDLELRESLREVNRFLVPYQCWYDQLDAFIHLIPQEVGDVVDWRVEAEERMKTEGKPGMSREEVRGYIQKFILAYRIYLPQLIEHDLLPAKTLRVVLSKDRLPV